MNYTDLELLIYDMYGEELQESDTPVSDLIQKFVDDEGELQEFMSTLINSIDVGKSPFSGKRFKGFAKDGVFLAKVEIEGVKA